MKKMILGSLLALSSTTAMAHEGGAVTLAKVAELAAHRADRLVVLGKLDAGFVNKIEKIQVSKVENAAPVAFRAILSQIAPSQGTPLQAELLFDHDGKALSFKALSGGTSGADPKWTGKAAGTLIENTLHYVLENSSDSMVTPYFSGLASVTLLKSTLNGETVAVGIMMTSTQVQKLHVYLKLDGSFISAEVLP